MVQFSNLFGNFVFLALFVLAGISFVVISQESNEAEQPLVEDALFNESYLALQDNLESLEDTSSIQYDQFTGEAPQPGFVSIVLFAIVGAGKAFGNVVILTFTVLIKLPLFILGIPSTTFSVIATWVIISLIIGAWRLYKIGG